MVAYESASRLFKVLMHPARLAILDELREGEACVSHLEAALGQRQAYVSQQLAVLRSAGVVRDRREGWNIYYHVADERVFAVLDAAQGCPEPPARIRHGLPLAGCQCPRCRAAAAERAPQAEPVEAPPELVPVA